MTLLIIALLVYAGLSVDRLRAIHFAWISFVASAGTYLSLAARAHERGLQGRDASDLLTPVNLAGNIALNFTLFCVALFIGRAIRLWKARRSK